jgi:hypothetical protein
VSDFQKKREEYLAIRKGASRTTPLARRAAKEQTSAVAGFIFDSPLDNPFGSMPQTVYAGSEGIPMSAPRRTQVDLMAPLNFGAEELTTPANVPFVAGPRMLARAGNAFVENIPTELKGFYSGSPVEKYKGISEGMLQSAKGTARELVDPTEMATRREFGTGSVRRAEMQQTADRGITEGNPKASAFLRAQATGKAVGEGDTVIEAYPVLKRDAVQVGRLENTQDVQQALTKDNPDIDQDIVDRATNHLYAQQGKQGQLVTRNRATSSTNLGPEAIGQATTSPVALRTLYSPKSMESWYDVVGDSPSTEQWKEMLGLFSALDRDFLLQNKKVFGENPSAAAVWKSYWKGKKNLKEGNNLGSDQKKYIEAVDNQMKTQTGLKKYLSKFVPNALVKPKGPTKVNEMNGKLVLQQSFNSSAKDLGGMNAFIVVDPKKGEFYSMLSDGHDLLGQTPPGFEELVNVVPIQKYRIGGGKEAGGARPKKELEAATKVYENTTELENRSGIPRLKNESVSAYQKRVARDFRGTATTAERLEATAASAMPLSVSGMLTREEER